MMTIGEFARLGVISVRTLHHYDSIGLLSPATVDASNGYRRYELAQLQRLNRIVALKDLGFSLAEVDTLLSEHISAAELRGMLRLRHSDLYNEIAEGRDRLQRLEARIEAIEAEDAALTEVSVTTRMPSMAVRLEAAARMLDPAAVEPVLGPLFADLHRRLASCKVQAAGPLFAEYERLEGFDHVLVHACAPIDSSAGEILSDELAAAGLSVDAFGAAEAVATCLHEGPLAGLPFRWQQLLQWIESSARVASGRPRETYHVPGEGPGTFGRPATMDSDAWQIELQQGLDMPPATTTSTVRTHDG